MPTLPTVAGVPTLYPTPARPVALLCALAALAGLGAAAAATPAPAATPAASPLDDSLSEQVRGLVLPAVQLPPGTTARVELQVGQLDPRLRLAPCQRIEPLLPPRAAAWGRMRIALRCVEGPKRWQVWLPVTVKVLAPALLPVRALPAGTVLAAEHLQTGEVDWAETAQAPLARAEQVLGRTLDRAWQPGRPLQPADLRQRHWFTAGDTVKLLARGSGFAVSGEAQALGPGIEGQPVRVRLGSGRVLTGRAVGERQVEVLL